MPPLAVKKDRQKRTIVDQKTYFRSHIKLMFFFDLAISAAKASRSKRTQFYGFSAVKQIKTGMFTFDVAGHFWIFTLVCIAKYHCSNIKHCETFKGFCNLKTLAALAYEMCQPLF